MIIHQNFVGLCVNKTFDTLEGLDIPIAQKHNHLHWIQHAKQSTFIFSCLLFLLFAEIPVVMRWIFSYSYANNKYTRLVL